MNVRCKMVAAVVSRSGFSRGAVFFGVVFFFVILVVVVTAPSIAVAGNPAAEEVAFQAAAARVAPSTVRIEVIGVRDEKEAAAGAGPSTGIVVGAEGWIVTSSFAVAPETVGVVVVLPDGSRHPAKVVGRDLARFVVLLKIEPPTPLSVSEPCPKKSVEVGQWAIALGRSWTGRTVSVAIGIISALDRGWGRAVQTDASVSPANYGGPLVDIEGRVIGMLAPVPADTAGMKLGTELYDSGIGFAVPMEDILERLPAMQAGRTIAPGLLGITYTSRDAFTQPPVIATVRAGSPASQAGLRPGDRIVAVDGGAVSRIAEIRHGMAALSAGDSVTLAVERPSAPATAGGPTPSATRLEKAITLIEELPAYRRPCLGIGLVRAASATTKNAGEKPADKPASVIAWVWPEGPAAKAGLRPGDVVESITAVRPDADHPDATPATGEERGLEPARPGLFAGIIAGEEIGTSFRVSFTRGGQRKSVDVVAGSVPVAVPEIPLGAPLGPMLGPAGEPAAKETVERLEAADLSTPATLVLPDVAAEEPLAVLVVVGPPRKDADLAAANRWRDAARAARVAVLLPAAANPLRWSPEDIPSIAKALDLLAAKRPIDRSRIAVVGMQTGGPFAWTIAESLAGAIRGVAILDGSLPRRGTISPSDPGRPLAVLLAPVPPDTVDADAARRRLETDVERLEKAGVPVGLLSKPVSDPPPFEAICRWVESLGIL